MDIALQNEPFTMFHKTINELKVIYWNMDEAVTSRRKNKSYFYYYIRVGMYIWLEGWRWWFGGLVGLAAYRENLIYVLSITHLNHRAMVRPSAESQV